MTSWRYLKDNYMYYDLLAKTLSISDGLQGYQVSGTISRAGRAHSSPPSSAAHHSSHLAPRTDTKGSGVFAPETITRHDGNWFTGECYDPIVVKEDMIIGALPALDLIEEGSL